MSGEELATIRPAERGGYSRRWRAIRRRTHAVLEPGANRDPLSIGVDVLLISLICISVVGIVLESMDSVYRRYAGLFDLIETVTVVVFSVEYVLRVWVSTERNAHADEAAGNTATRLRYMLTPVALIDLVAIAPFYLFTFGLMPSSDLRFLRALRLLRILKLTRYSAAFETLGVVFRENLKSFTAALFVLIVVMLIAATGMYYFEHEAQPEAFSSIPAAMWWAFATLTTVGYGDITPITAAGKTFGAVISVVGIAMVALPTGILASAFTEQLRRNTERYRLESDNAWRDGVLSDDERAALESLREQLGLSEHSASQILDEERTRAMLREAATAQCCPACGRPQ